MKRLVVILTALMVVMMLLAFSYADTPDGCVSERRGK